MLNRRTFIASASAACASITLHPYNVSISAAENEKRLRLAIVTTEWRYRSHAWHMGERFLVGYPFEGKWHQPAIDVVAAYVDQFPEGDLSRGRAKEFGFTIYPTIAECCGEEPSRWLSTRSW